MSKSKAQKSAKKSSVQASLPVNTSQSPELIASDSTKVLNAIQANKDFKNTPTIKAAADDWGASIATIEETATARSNAVSFVESCDIVQFKNLDDWGRKKALLAATIGIFCDGDAAKIKSWGGTPAVKAAPVLDGSAPTGLRGIYTKDWATKIRWNAVRNQRGYYLQLGDGTPNGWGPTINCGEAHYLPQGLSPGQKLAVRVAVQRSKTGMSPWSDVLIVTVR